MFTEIVTQQPIGVFIRAALLRGIGGGKVDLESQGGFEGIEHGPFTSIIYHERATQVPWELLQAPRVTAVTFIM